MEQPGVIAASASTCLPLAGGCFGNGVVVEGRGFDNSDPSAGNTAFRAVAGDYFETIGIQVLRGRGFERGDVERSEPVAVIDQTFADQIFPDEDALGKRVSWSLPPPGPRETPRYTWLTIVGIVAPTAATGLGEPLLPQLLGAVGIYGVISYVVSQRTNEIGVRIALGAAPRAVAGMIVRQGSLVAVGGLLAGLAVALAGSRLIESLLYDVSPRDPIVFGATTLALLGVSLLACWLPARRAARVSPVEALRAD